jgi:hypothetical protein
LAKEAKGDLGLSTLLPIQVGAAQQSRLLKKSLELVSNPRITPAGKAQADLKAEQPG